MYGFFTQVMKIVQEENPTHFAVALRYDATRMASPEVVAKGADEVAAAIRERAVQHAVLRVESPRLARALFRSTEVGRAVPPELFTAVAQILAWAYRIKAGAPQGWTVAHKTGTGANGTANDVGVAFPLSGAPVILATYFTGATQASDDQRDAVIAEATRRVFKALGRD